MTEINNAPLLCVVGHTASGKSDVALRIAQTVGGDVLSCDSVQIYRGFDIGSAKMTDTQGVPHHMIDVADPTEMWSAGMFATRSRAILCASDRPVVVCGGTGFWLKALTNGIADLPVVPRGIYGDDAYMRLQAVDPRRAAELSPQDTKRIHRSLDLVLHTGNPWHKMNQPDLPPLPAVFWGLCAEDRETPIIARTKSMFAAGLLEETESLLARGVPADCPPMQSIGYLQARAVLRGDLTRNAAVDEVILRTRQYAKRQMTWFRRQTDARWITRRTNEPGTDFVRRAARDILESQGDAGF